MPGPLPKNSKLRQRQNKVATAATLGTVPKRRTPKLFATERPWHPLTLTWWRDVWRSPMAAEYLQADLHGLYRLAVLVDAYWHEPSVKLSAEIRLLGQCFGLTPIDRRRLQWSVASEAPARSEAPRPATPPGEDPRHVLQVVS